jgi:maltooligosyltrehalose trehalohydrolase
MSLGKLKIGAALVLTSPFLPLMFQGEEWGASTPFSYFTDYQEPELANAVREGRCREFAMFGWKPEETADPQARETFEKSKLNWPEVSRSPHAEILEWHKKLIQLRRSETDLNDGRMNCVRTRFDEERRWLVVTRGAVLIACNFSSNPQTVTLDEGDWRTLLISETSVKIAGDKVNLPPDSVAILKRK